MPQVKLPKSRQRKANTEPKAKAPPKAKTESKAKEKAPPKAKTEPKAKAPPKSKTEPKAKAKPRASLVAAKAKAAQNSEGSAECLPDLYGTHVGVFLLCMILKKNLNLQFDYIVN